MARFDRAHLHGMWELMPPEIQKALQEATEEPAGDVARPESVVIRRCSRCGGTDTTDCHAIKGIADPTIGLCVTCGYLWCLECETHLISTVTCGHWRICASCPERKDESGYCRAVPWECAHIKDWLDKNNPRA
jgi:hypothetical protein